MITPKQVKHSNFMGSYFQNAEMEAMLKCIAITQYRMNPDEWTPFTWKEYVSKCDHKPTPLEEMIFVKMVTGGSPSFKIPNLEAGLLDFENDKYSVTDKLLKIMEPYAKTEKS